MDKNYQYYSNRNPQGHSNKGFGNSPCVGPITNDRNFDYLLRKNFLSEYSTEEDQYEVLYNLGILQRLNKLKQIIDNKVIQSGGVAWDDQPTLGNTDHVLSSDVLKQEFLKYCTKTQVDNLIQQIWNRILEQIPNVDNELSDISENPVQNKVVKEALDSISGELHNKVSRSEIEDILSNLEGIATILNQIQEIEQSLQSETSRAQDAEQTISDRVTELEEHGVNPEDNVKHVILTQEEFENLSEQEPNVLYIIVESSESRFGDPFPFILG